MERLKAGYIACVRRRNECACRCAHVQVGIHTCAHKRTHTSCMRMPAISARSNVEAPFDCPSERRQGVGAVSIARLVTTSAFYVPSKSNVVCISCSAAGAACCHEQFSAGEAVCIARVVEVVMCFFSLSMVPNEKCKRTPLVDRRRHNGNEHSSAYRQLPSSLSSGFPQVSCMTTT